MKRREALNILGLSEEASDEEIRARFRELAKKYHPDMGGSPDKFREVNEAYQALIKRADFFDFDLSTSSSDFDINLDFEKIARKAKEITKELLEVFGFSNVGEYEVRYQCPVCGHTWIEKTFVEVNGVVEEVCNTCISKAIQGKE